MNSFKEALESCGPKPPDDSEQKYKKNWSEKLSNNLALVFANCLRKTFPSILPDEQGRKLESKARTAKGFKQLDVNYSTVELGLGLGVSIKTLNFRDKQGKGRYTKNYTRIDNELRAEAKDYHQRQPYSLMVAVVFLPIDSCDDGKGNHPSSFGAAIRSFRHRANRKNPKNEEELFERVFVGIYEGDGLTKGEVWFMDVTDAPPKRGRPLSPPLINLEELIREIIRTYDERNNPPFEWAE